MLIKEQKAKYNMKLLLAFLLLITLPALSQTDTVKVWLFLNPAVMDTSKTWTLKGVRGFALLESITDSTSSCEVPRVAIIDKQVYFDEKMRNISASLVKYIETR
jgi:hypothetical protein